MPVEKDINLDKPLTEEEIRQMEEEANRLEELAEQAQDDAKKTKEFQKEEEKILNEAIKNVERIEKEAEKAEKARLKIGKSIREVNQLAEHRGALTSMGGTEPFAEGEDFGFGGMIPGAGQIQTGRTAFGTGQGRAPMGGLETATQMREMVRLEAEKRTREAEKKSSAERKANQELIRANAKALAEQKKAVSKIQGSMNEALAISKNPVGFGMGRITGLIGRAGIVGFVALAVYTMANQIFEEVKRMFGPGGPFDIRKQMLDRDRELIEMDNILARRSGRVFFTSDVELLQGPPDYSNTERLRDRAVRFQALHLGE